MNNLVRTGVALEPRTVEDLEEWVDKLNERRSHKVTKSELVREVVPIGLTGFKLTDSYSNGRSMNRRERQAWIRQAVHEYEADDPRTDITPALIEALAEAESIDESELERAILEIKLDR